MFTMKEIPHRVFAAFVRGENDAAVAKTIQEATKENPAYKLLIDLVEQTNYGTLPQWDGNQLDGIMSHAHLENIMTAVLDGSVTGKDRFAFLQQLVLSPHFYQRCLSKITQMESQLFLDQDRAQIEQLALRPQPTSELLRAVEKHGNTRLGIADQSAKPGRLAQQESFWDKLMELFAFDSPVLRPAFYAAPALAILLVAGLWVSSNWVADAGIYDQQVPYSLAEGVVFDWQQPMPSGNRTNRGLEDMSELLRSLKTVLLSASRDYQDFQYLKVINDLEKVAPHYAVPLENAVAAMPDQSSDSLTALFRDSRQVVQEFNFFLGLNHLAQSRLDRVFPQTPDVHLDAAEKYFLRAKQLAAAYALETGGRESYWLEKTISYRQQDQTKKRF